LEVAVVHRFISNRAISRHDVEGRENMYAVWKKTPGSRYGTWLLVDLGAEG
jgi:hypothetical protein